MAPTAVCYAAGVVSVVRLAGDSIPGRELGAPLAFVNRGLARSDDGLPALARRRMLSGTVNLLPRSVVAFLRRERAGYLSGLAVEFAINSS